MDIPREPDPVSVVAALRAAATASNGQVALLPGIDDHVMDAWETPVPEHIRAIAREVGGFGLVDWRGEIDQHEAFTFEHLDNAEPDNRCGPPGTFRIMHSDGTATTYYVDVDPKTGAWNGVFSLWDSLNARFEAPSLAHWLLELADGIHRAADAVRAGCYECFDDSFSGWFFGEAPDSGDADAFRDWKSRWELNLPKATVVAAPTARSSTDPVLSEVGARLPDCASVADLRGVTERTYIRTIDLPGMGIDAAFRRFHGGRILAALPWDG